MGGRKLDLNARIHDYGIQGLQNIRHETVHLRHAQVGTAQLLPADGRTHNTVNEYAGHVMLP
jgi:hypothetical protein